MRIVAPTLRAAILVGMVALVWVSHAPGAEAQERLSPVRPVMKKGVRA